ncbi:MAG TPA: hypothetical protein VFW93_03300 [Aquabacterium sp.]|uniref:hypothetical protein n=1 Tax=Aquabacterium sp. TaxID=1872578 RepID=UPI002E3119CF|nr:hypothetical protein [Aquabacterium sp.]HEX5355218.1 hypothetical protein [Aquabacterium sp.]
MAWSDNSCWNAASSLVYDVDGVLAHSGGHSVKVSLRSGLFQLVQPVTLPPDWRFTLGVWVRAAAPMMIKISLRQAGAPYADYGSRLVRATDQWTYVSVDAFSHGLSEPDARQALFIVGSATPGTVWLDDAVMTGARSNLGLPTAAVPRQYFGTHVLHNDNLADAFEDSNAGSMRVWDSERSQWHAVQRKRPVAGKSSKYEWGSLDQRVKAADSAKADVLMVLGGYAPAWASLDEDAQDDEPASRCYRCDEHPRRMSEWQGWVKDIATRYSGKSMKYWEVWNEPYFNANHDWCPSRDGCASGLGSGYRGSPEQLLQLQNEAARVLKSVNPDAKVVSAGISYQHRDYLDYFLKLGGARSADVIGYHLYLEGGYPEMMMSHVLGIRALMRDHGASDKPLWSTETGIGQIDVGIDPACRAAQAAGLPQPRISELNAAYLARFMVVGWASGLGRVYQYAWDDQHGWPSSPTRIRPGTNLSVAVNASGKAFYQVSAWMTGRRMSDLDRVSDGGVWKAAMTDSAGGVSYIAWHPARTRERPAQMTVPAGVSKRCDLTGQCTAIKPGDSVSVDFSPIFLTN